MPRRQKTAEELELLFFESLLEPESVQQVETSEGGKKETSSSRAKEFEDLYRKDPLLAVIHLRQDAIDLIDAFEPRVGETLPVPQEQINLLSREYDKFKALISKVESLYEIRYREITNKHLDTIFEGQETPRPPSQMPGSLQPDYLGRRWNFVREGGDRKAPEVDWTVTKEVVSEDIWEQITDRVEHPAQKARVDQVPNLKKLLSLIRSGKVTLEQARRILKPGKWMTPRFQVKLKQD